MELVAAARWAVQGSQRLPTNCRNDMRNQVDLGAQRGSELISSHSRSELLKPPLSTFLPRITTIQDLGPISMDPLSVIASVVGILAAASQVASSLSAIKSSMVDAPRSIDQALSQVNGVRIALSAIEKFLLGIHGAPRKRIAMIQVDDLVAILTETVLTFDDLEALVTPFLETPKVAMRDRLKWSWEKDKVESILVRLERHKSSMSLILNIIQSVSDLEAEKSRHALQSLVLQLLESNTEIARRLRSLEDMTESQSTLTSCFRNGKAGTNTDIEVINKRSSSVLETIETLSIRDESDVMRHQSLASFPGATFQHSFEADLNTTRVYTRTQLYNSDVSFTSSAVRTHVWSVFSGLSLSEISDVSVIALPLYPHEIYNGHWYLCEDPGNGITENTGRRLKVVSAKQEPSRSLFQTCVQLRQRLAQVPGFDVHLNDSDDEDEGKESMDPVSLLWRCLRKGTPLLTLYNSTQPKDPLQIDEKIATARKPKVAVFKFIEACLMELKLPIGECFSLQDLFGDDTTGFVKVTQLINVFLDEAQAKGLLMASETDDAMPAVAMPGAKMSFRDHMVRELVNTERKYVQDLEILHELKKTIEQRGVISGDVVHAIFLNINAILDFQRRFLIKIETTNAQPDDRQEWGLAFVNYEDAFAVYPPFIANQRKAAAVAMREFDKISLTNHPLVQDGFHNFGAFLLKPMARLIKYPLLLKELRDKTGADEETKAGLTAAIEASNRVLHQASLGVDRELRDEAFEDLCARMEDWKNHRVDYFGDLLLYGHFPVYAGRGNAQKEYTMYLFERILLCCKELSPNKYKDKLMGTQKYKKDKNRSKEPNKNAKLQLKGRIFMANVTTVLSHTAQSNYTVQIHWAGALEAENFTIKFVNEATMKEWFRGIDGQRKKHAASLDYGNSPDVSMQKFSWMRDQHAMPNPYTEQSGDDDEEYVITPSLPIIQQSPQGQPRNVVGPSLRARSVTGDSFRSLAGITPAPPPRFPMGLQNPPPSLQTQLAIPSPGQGGGNSYFSPIAESPTSPQRTSMQPNMFFIRTDTQFPDNQREQLSQDQQYATAPLYIRSDTTQIPMESAESRTVSPPLGMRMSGDNEISLPNRWQVKVNYDGNHFTMMVASNITYQTLIDRIDAKAGRFSNNAIARGEMRLVYHDEDGDFCTIESDDDVQIVWQEWCEAQKHQHHTGSLGEIEFFVLPYRII